MMSYLLIYRNGMTFIYILHCTQFLMEIDVFAPLVPKLLLGNRCP
jgi:hypothetical protein